MKTIKKYWAVIAGVILAIIAAIFVSDKLNKKKIEKTDKKLDDNNQKIAQLLTIPNETNYPHHSA